MRKSAFITNAPEATLKKRISQLIEHSEELKFLVGFFYFSGWREVAGSLAGRDDIIVKILVGLEVDGTLGRIVEHGPASGSLTNEDKAERFFDSLKVALNDEELDSEDFYSQVRFFLDLVDGNRLLIRRTADPNHAKLYLFKIQEHLRGIADTKFITGSSNLTRAGILEQNEFNVEIGDYGTQEAEEYFDALWESAVPITENDSRRGRLLDIVKNRTQAAEVTPFEAYALILKTYAELQEQKTVKPLVIRLLESGGYRVYSYQIDAVNQALTVLENYNGVVIADVVGLGKSVIAGMVAKNLGRRGMIICPPSLIGDPNGKSGWKKYVHDFKLYDWEVRSSGDLENVAEYLQDQGRDIEVVIVDEVHRFRNQDTTGYEHLSVICKNRKTILLTATPFNNTPADIFALLKLFIVPGKSKISLDENLEARFSHYQYLFFRLSFISKNWNSANAEKKTRAERFYKELIGELPIDLRLVKTRAHTLSMRIRATLQPVMIRRNRLDLINDPVYGEEVEELSKVENPRELFFELSKEQSAFYDRVIEEYFGENGRFTGAIYQPFSYESVKDTEEMDELENRAFQQQRNLYDFMRRLLVKRFESSFGSFRRSVENFIRVHRCVQEFIDNSGGRYILDRKLVERSYDLDPDEIDKMLEEFAIALEAERRPRNDRIYDVNAFERKEEFMVDIASDLSLFVEIAKEIDQLSLVENDPKGERLVKEIGDILNESQNGAEPPRKVILFSEYVDTVKHLEPMLQDAFPGQVLSVQGSLNGQLLEEILANFDASVKKRNQKDDYRILLTSDKLSEGFNLNRAGAIINYDIPWNPTRVIQRLGRINRIGAKVFEKLRIFNFFPTEQGSTVVRSREIAGNKMFLIHNTLGEDSKIFDVDETPVPSELFTRISRNPEESEEEGILTRIRRELSLIEKEHPDVIRRIKDLPSRVKTAKNAEKYGLVICRRKSLGFFVSLLEGESDTDPESILFEECLPLIQCGYSEPRLEMSSLFWSNYEKMKNYSEVLRSSASDTSLETKAMSNLKTAQRHFGSELEEDLPFIRTLIRDLRDFRTLPKFTLRRFAELDIKLGKTGEVQRLKDELAFLRRHLGDDYLDGIERNLGSLKSEIVVAVENWAVAVD
ncbi:MAG: helicase-related protein [Syntrophales bacterium]|nr:helicase-related protein [Syntrophales bacterium]